MGHAVEVGECGASWISDYWFGTSGAPHEESETNGCTRLVENGPKAVGGKGGKGGKAKAAAKAATTL